MKKSFIRVIKPLFIIVLVCLGMLYFQNFSMAAQAEDLTQLGITYYKEGEFDKAIERLKEAIELDPNIAEAYYYLGLVYEAKGIDEEAIKAYEGVVDNFTPDNEIFEEAYQHLHNLFIKNKMWDEVIELLRETLRYSEHLSVEELLRVHHGLGMCYIEKELYDESIKEFEMVIQVKPDLDPNIYYFLGCNFKELSNREKAIENFNKYLELAPEGELADEAKELLKQLTEIEE